MGISKQISSHRPLGIQGHEIPKHPGLRVVFAGGGTGGHLFPGIALAKEFEARFPGSRILFVSSGRPIEEKVLSKTGYETAFIQVSGIKGKSLWAKFKSAMILPKGVLTAVALLRKFKPHVVMGLGGYSAGPVILGAWMLGIHRAICEQNQVPGITNKILARFSDRIYVAYTNTPLKAAPEKIRVFGNPVRREIIESLQKAGNDSGGLQKVFTVLILGGSQGAHGLNTALVEAVGHLNHPEQYRFIHQTGEADSAMVQRAYDEKKISHTTVPFFEDMASLYRQADLVVCRSGATTLAEVAIAGCAVIFVPFPHAADNHQVFNAKPLVEAGAAEMILEKDLNGHVLAQRLEFYAKHPEIRAQMKKKIKTFGYPDAAERIVEDVSALMGAKAMTLSCAA